MLFTRNTVEFRMNDSETGAECIIPVLTVMKRSGRALRVSPAAIGRRLLLGKPTEPRQLENIYRSISLWDDGSSHVLRLGLMNYSEPLLSLSACYDQQAEILLLWYKSVHKNIRDNIKGSISWRDRLLG
jgi:hypothetical protein